MNMDVLQETRVSLVAITRHGATQVARLAAEMPAATVRVPGLAEG